MIGGQLLCGNITLLCSQRNAKLECRAVATRLAPLSDRRRQSCQASVEQGQRGRLRHDHTHIAANLTSWIQRRVNVEVDRTQGQFILGDDVRQTSVCRVFEAHDKLKFVGHSGA